MARPRLPDEVHELTGAWEKDPQRRRPAAPKSAHPLGNAPSYMTKDEKVCWRELATTVPPGVLTGADRWLVEMACILMAKMRRREDMTGPERSQLTFAMSRMGMTPADRSRIVVAQQEQPASPYAEFLN